jgi:hypothetical protein
MTDRNGVGWTNDTGSQGAEPGPAVDEDPSDDDPARSEFQLWHVYDAGGPEPRLRVRCRDGMEVPDWRRGPDLATALRQAEAEGWHAYDSEPGGAPGEHAIIHLKRILSP